MAPSGAPSGIRNSSTATCLMALQQRKRGMGVALKDYGVAIAVIFEKHFSWLFENQSRYHQAAQFLSKEKGIITMKKLYRKRKHSGLHATIRISFGQSTSSAGTQSTSENGRSILILCQSSLIYQMGGAF